MSKTSRAALALFSLAVVSCAEPRALPTAPREAAVRSQMAARSQHVVAGSTVGLMAVGPNTACALTAMSQLYCWGANDRGQFGAAASAPSSSPILAGAGAQGVMQLSTGDDQHMCGLTASNAAVCWGRGGFGQIGGGTAGAGANLPTAVVGGISFREVAAGRLSTCGVSTTGAGFCWGANQNGEIGNASIPLGTAAHGTPVPVDGGLVFKTISKGFIHACGIDTNGVAYCWGDNSSGQLGLGFANASAVRSPLPIVSSERFQQISAGGKSTCAITTDGRAFCWGENLSGQLGDGTTSRQATPTAVATSLRFSYIVTTSANVAGATVQFGKAHTCALTTDGAAYCWGLNDNGQLGDGTTTDKLTPTAVAGGITFTSVATGEQFTCGMRGRAVWCWGLNSSGQLGNGTLVNSSLPLRVGAPFDQGAQAINFGTLGDKTFGDAAFGVSASATSGLTVAFASDAPGVCTVSGATVTIEHAGTCVIRASQAGDLSWLPAADVTQSFTVRYGVSALLPPGDKTFNAGSTVPVKFQLTSANGQPIDGALAASLGCTVNVSFNGGSPVCADYAPESAQFHANIKTAKTLTAGATYPLSITVTVGSATVANATFNLVAK